MIATATLFVRIIAAFMIVPLLWLLVTAHLRGRVPVWMSSAMGGFVATCIWAGVVALQMFGILSITSNMRLLLGNFAVIVLALSLARILWFYIYEDMTILTPEAASKLAEVGQARLVLMINNLPHELGDSLVVMLQGDTPQVYSARHIRSTGLRRMETHDLTPPTSSTPVVVVDAPVIGPPATMTEIPT